MYALHVDKEAVSQDLLDIRSENQHAAAIVSEFLRETASDQDRLEKMASSFYQDAILDVDEYEEQQQGGRNLRRLKLLEMVKLKYPYRIIYATDPSKKCHYVLGVLSRDYAYDANHPKTARIIEAYDKLGIERRCH